MPHNSRIMLAGLGPHARRIYYPLLQKYAQEYNITIPVLLELASQADIVTDYLQNFDLQPEHILWLDDSHRVTERLSFQLEARLAPFVSQVDAVLIATEPKAHMGYAQWAIENDLDVLMDKPISAPIGASIKCEAADQVYADYQHLLNLLKSSTSQVTIQCQRRAHTAYQFIYETLANTVQNFDIPISYLDIYHADGMWVMPHELFGRENHPYQYGYGKLLHSGYHFVDLLLWLMTINEELSTKQADSVEIITRQYTPYDFLAQVNEEDYQTLFGMYDFSPYYDHDALQAANTFGELDAYILSQFKRNNRTITTANLTLQQNSFSRRAWTETPRDVYKGNGRVRHERLTAQIGNVMTVQVQSYQSYESKKEVHHHYGVGHADHFDVHIFRNVGVIGGQAHEQIQFGKAIADQHQHNPNFLGHNELARERLFLEFIRREAQTSTLQQHHDTNLFLSHTLKALAMDRAGQLPIQSFDLPTSFST